MPLDLFRIYFQKNLKDKYIKISDIILLIKNLLLIISPFELQKLYIFIPGIWDEGIIKLSNFPLTNDFPWV